MLKTWLPIILGIIFVPIISQKISDMERKADDSNKEEVTKKIKKLNLLVIIIILGIIIMTAIGSLPQN